MRFKYDAYDNTRNAGSIAQLMLQSGQISAQQLVDLANIAANQEQQGGANTANLINSIATSVGKGVNQAAAKQPAATTPGDPTAWQPTDWAPPSNAGHTPTMDEVLSRIGTPQPSTPASASRPGGAQYQGPVQPGLQQQSAEENALQNWLSYFAGISGKR